MLLLQLLHDHFKNCGFSAAANTCNDFHQIYIFVFKFLNDVQIGFLRGSEKVRRS